MFKYFATSMLKYQKMKDKRESGWPDFATLQCAVAIKAALIPQHLACTYFIWGLICFSLFEK